MRKYYNIRFNTVKTRNKIRTLDVHNGEKNIYK